MKFLFVCTGNTCRSPMAESLFNAQSQSRGKDYVAQSAGLGAWPEEPAAPEAVAAVRRFGGLDLKNHRSQGAQSLDLTVFNWIIAMNRRQKNQLIHLHPELSNQIWTLGELAGEPELEVQDPFGLSQDYYDQTAALLLHLIEAVLDRFDKNF